MFKKAENKSWLPDYIPASATNIKEYQNHDNGDLKATFDYRVGDKQSVENNCLNFLEQAELSQYVCPSLNSRVSVITLRPDGRGSFISYVLRE